MIIDTIYVDSVKCIKKEYIIYTEKKSYLIDNSIIKEGFDTYFYSGMVGNTYVIEITNGKIKYMEAK